MTFAPRALIPVALLALALGSLFLGAVRAESATIGADGTIHACYKAKGKPKGALRVVPAGKPCKRKQGERPLSWSAGSAPTTVSDPNMLVLFGYIQQQEQRIVALESILDGVTNSELGGVISKLDGITGVQLQDAVDSLPVISSLCTQLSGVTTQVDALRTVIAGLGLNGVLTALGGVLNIPVLPAALGPYSCPAT
jgi:hypothetical protein